MPVNAALSAGWFWSENGLNRFADVDDFVGMTKRINGGTIGLEDRQARYKRILASM
jgi:putative chitinase